MLRSWSSGAGEKGEQKEMDMPGDDPAVKEEIERINDALNRNDRDVLAEYGDVNGASDRLIALRELPTAMRDRGRSIDSYATWITSRLSGPASDL